MSKCENKTKKKEQKILENGSSTVGKSRMSEDDCGRSTKEPIQRYLRLWEKLQAQHRVMEMGESQFWYIQKYTQLKIKST